ncbi:MAG: hypothetical protein ACXVFV_01255, partial [Mycobacteriales bacterium]
DPAGAAAAHPERREVRMAVGVLRDGSREVRMAVGVLRDGSRESVLRLRGTGDDEDERVTGGDLAPGLAEALLATLEE